MAVAPTGAIYKAMTIDGESSRTYGVYITGQAVYNAPQREVEMISIAGRNGQLALDKGRFENIEVTYPAGIYADTEEDFAEAVSNFRNFLCSRSGYVRIEDEYNPNEYRMGIYKSGLKVETAGHKAGEFEITFDCKPQRWLTDGETAVTVDSGDVISNPTLFESSPLLEVEGYGIISINGHEIELTNNMLGNIELLNNPVSFNGLSGEIVFSEEYVNNGDPISVNVSFRERIIAAAVSSIKSKSYTQPNTGAVSITDKDSTGNVYLQTNAQKFSFVAGTDSTQSDTSQVAMTYQRAGLTTIYNCTIYVTYSFSYDASEHKIIYGTSYSITCDSGYNDFATNNPSGGTFNSILANSSVSTLGHPTYIDCDLGEAYKTENGEHLSLNAYIDLGSDLPKLASGANTITYDDTITDLKVIPRWWKI